MAPQLITWKPQLEQLTWLPKCEIGCTAAPLPPFARPVSSCLELREGLELPSPACPSLCPKPPGPACPSLCPSLCPELPGLMCPSLCRSCSRGPACQVSPPSSPQPRRADVFCRGRTWPGQQQLSEAEGAQLPGPFQHSKPWHSSPPTAVPVAFPKPPARGWCCWHTGSRALPPAAAQPCQQPARAASAHSACCSPACTALLARTQPLLSPAHHRHWCAALSHCRGPLHRWCLARCAGCHCRGTQQAVTQQMTLLPTHSAPLTLPREVVECPSLEGYKK